MKRAVLGIGVVLLVIGARWAMSAPAPQAVHERRDPPAADAVARGHALYATYGCVMCHGANGAGGFANPNSETDGKVPGVQRVKEGYTAAELRTKLLDGAPKIGKADAKGPVPPYRMPGWRDRMTRAEADDLVQYLFSLEPRTAEDKWR